MFWKSSLVLLQARHAKKAKAGQIKDVPASISMVQASFNSVNHYPNLFGSTEKKLTKQATLGSLFKSQNGKTWEPDQTKDLTFELVRADFASSGSAVIENSPLPMVNISNTIRTNGCLKLTSLLVSFY